MIGPWLRGTDLAFGVLRLCPALLVGWFLPDVLRELEDVYIVETEVTGVVASEDEEFILADGTGGVISSG